MNDVTVQNAFLAKLVEKQSRAYVFLVNGIKLKGVVTGYDDFVILLGDPSMQIVYKHAISAIVPQRPQDLANVPELANRRLRRRTGG